MEKEKKRKSFIVAVLLLLLALIITMSGITFAKYYTEDEGNNTATVAQWGFVLSADAENIFGKKYTDEGNGSVVFETSSTGKISIQANSNGENTKNVVAPGAKGYATFSISGEAEVRAQLSVVVEITSDISLTRTVEESTTTYKPIVWKLYKTDTGTDTLVANGVSEINAYFSGATLEVGQQSEKAGDYKLTWEWAFEGVNDEADTILAKLAKDGDSKKAEYNVDSYSLDLGVNINISVVQIQG